MGGCENEADGCRGLCSSCYSSVRSWSANKTPAEREKRRGKLNLFLARFDALDGGTIKINHIGGTANDKSRRNVRHARSARNAPARNPRHRAHSRSRSGRGGAATAISEPKGSVH